MLSDPEMLLSGNGEANIMKLYEAGAKFCCGNDGGVPFTWPGTLFLEMEMLEAIGLAAADVLRAATVNAADLLGVRGELGSLEAGKSADIVLLSGDPLVDIRAVERVEAVFRSGALLHYGPRFYLESRPDAVSTT
jgi:imidazolonepropionase-like amidohydrolase